MLGLGAGISLVRNFLDGVGKVGTQGLCREGLIHRTLSHLIKTKKSGTAQTPYSSNHSSSSPTHRLM